MTVPRLISLIVVLCIVIFETSAQTIWRHVPGPYGGFIQSVQSDGFGVLYAVTAHDLFRSSDEGSSWARVAGEPLSRSTLSSQTLVLPNGTILQASGERNTLIMRSTDGGASWHATGRELIDTTGTFARPFVYDSTARMVYVFTRAGILGSEDNGVTWQRVGPWSWGSHVVFHDDELYVYATSGQALRRISPRRSFAFTEIRSPGDLETRGLWVAPDGTIYLAQYNPVQQRAEFHRSLDSGATWLRTGSGWVPTGMLFGSGVIYAFAGGISYRSTNGGALWSTYGAIDDGAAIYNVVETRNSGLIASSSIGTLRSTNRGRTWHLSSRGIDAVDIRDIEAAPDGTVYALTEHGLHRGDDEGRTWRQLGSAASNVRAGHQIAVSRGGVLYHLGAKLLRSSDRGETWQETGGRSASPITFMGSDRGVLLIANGGRLSLYFEETGRWVETERGEGWARVSAIDDAGGIFSGTEGTGKLYHSADTGRTWTLLMSFSDGPYSIAVGRDSTLYITTINALQWRRALSDTWERSTLTGGPEQITDMEIVEPGGVYIAGTTRIHHTPDLTTPFRQVEQGLPPRGPFLLARGDTRTLYVGTPNDGIYATDLSAVADADPTVPDSRITIAPHPAVRGSRIGFRLDRSARVIVALFDQLGRRIRTLADRVMPAGEQTLVLETGGLPPGAYVLRVIDGERIRDGIVIVAVR